MLYEEKIKRIISKEVSRYYYSQLNDFCCKQIAHDIPLYQFDIKDGHGCLENDKIKVTFDINVYNRASISVYMINLFPRNYFFIENLTIEKKSKLLNVNKFFKTIDGKNTTYDYDLVANYTWFQDILPIFIETYGSVFKKFSESDIEQIEMPIYKSNKSFIRLIKNEKNLEVSLINIYNGVLEVCFNSNLAKCKTNFYPSVPSEKPSPLKYANLIYLFNDVLKYMIENRDVIKKEFSMNIDQEKKIKCNI